MEFFQHLTCPAMQQWQQQELCDEVSTKMNAEWNADRIAQLSSRANLRNTCCQIEEQYVLRPQNAMYKGCCIVREWPAIGELGRYRVDGVQIRFVTRTKRSIEVQRADGAIVATFRMQPGLGEKLYASAHNLVFGQ